MSFGPSGPGGSRRPAPVPRDILPRRPDVNTDANRSVSGPTRISTPIKHRQTSTPGPTHRTASASSNHTGPTRTKKASPPGPSRLRAQPYALQQRMQSASAVLSSTPLLTLLSIAKQQSPAQTRRHAQHEVLGLDGSLAAPPSEWPTDWTGETDDDKRLAIGMKWSAKKATDKMRTFARRAVAEARANAEIVERRKQRMIESAIGEGVPLGIKVEAGLSTRDTPKGLVRPTEVASDGDVLVKSEEAMELDVKRQPSPPAEKGKTRQTRVISDSDDDATEPNPGDDVEMLDADAVRRRIKGTFSNRRSLGKKRGP